ncbi:hypothetical protein L1049_006396 [Liquidambar formosana]|uniref:non-specific serine/threonine protein kinase n=1 Tax=Liquidambar formosana TaxID=63359 RepID=A0AAP0RFC2_LIQFO
MDYYEDLIVLSYGKLILLGVASFVILNCEFPMASASFIVFSVLSHLASLVIFVGSCPPEFVCGNLPHPISFPFTSTEFPGCGLVTLNCTDEPFQTIQLKENGRWYNVIEITREYTSAGWIKIHDQELEKQLDNRSCHTFNNLSLPNSPSISFTFHHLIAVYKCTYQQDAYFKGKGYSSYNDKKCTGYSIYYIHPNGDLLMPPARLPHQCSGIQLPSSLPPGGYEKPDDPFTRLNDIWLEYRISPGCQECHLKGGNCSNDSRGNFRCLKKENHKVVILATVIPTAAVVICLLIFLCRKRWKSASSNFLSRNISADPSSKSDLERGTVFFGVPVFSYGELEEATNNFDPTKELGDGGFGTVYHGKLQDGREVAVKRLYEHNYKRVERFMNEVEILTRLRHKNLVSLYGCTSRHSRELLLVYEFIPNGTVADHLHGDRAKPCSLTWPVRMSIAIETADALAYLHASDTIHRDVKTANILLDHNFSVKVADFGISRLFPTDVTHVSTAPQGTPGYVDPEYHQCYQLTDRSDVYSFGVVLIELISSLPAVDISRHRQEINLANLAKNKIQKRAFGELVDPCLGFESNLMVRRMTTSVAELAFRCLQQDKEMRPSMDEVFEVLKGIESEKYEVEKEDALDDETGVLKSIRPPTSPVSDDAGLLKNMQPLSSPNSVTEKWVSRSTTPSASA